MIQKYMYYTVPSKFESMTLFTEEIWQAFIIRVGKTTKLIRFVLPCYSLFERLWRTLSVSTTSRMDGHESNPHFLC